MCSKIIFVLCLPKFSFYLKLNHTPCISVPHFIYSYVNEHLGFFHLLAMVSNAVLNMNDHLFLSGLLSESFGIYSEVELMN